MIVHFSLLIHKNFRAFTFYPFIFIKNKEDLTNKMLINHEKIHLKQQIELLIIFFFIIYFLEFITYLFNFLSNLSFALILYFVLVSFSSYSENS